ncbi:MULTISPECIES: hypothetical protein [unclassified Nitrosospira]|nr:MULTISPECIES: hypothetical protein [unclassified Nitrosospira]PTR15713.1 hypothetical protein C8R31_103306 [Nitrosospira sp. Nsp2]WON74862.1 hypothetical protein R5L00_05085 [Nitrosospira sp. Is2]
MDEMTGKELDPDSVCSVRIPNANCDDWQKIRLGTAFTVTRAEPPTVYW